MKLINRQRYRQTAQHNTAYKLYTELVSSFKERERQTVITAFTALIMLTVMSACLALSVRVIQRQYKAIQRETELFYELIEEHSIQVY